jgi:replicative DNA helicase
MNFKNWTTVAKLDLKKELDQELKLEMIAQGFLEPEGLDFDLIPIEDSLEEAKKRLNHPGDISGISTGYHKLDSILGGIEDEELIVVSGGTGQGKTQFVQGMILNMALNNIPVLFFTLEMPPVETTIRFMKMIKSKDAGDILPDLPIYYYHGDNANLQVLEEAIKQGIERGIRVAVIDHLHFFAKTTQNQAAEIGNIAREIKLMARRYHIPIILIAHVRKISGGGIPGLEDLKDSSGIAQDADSVIMIWRKVDATEETEKRRLSLRVRKNRRMGIISGVSYQMDENTYLQETDFSEIFDDF